ncbi:hypothetical protein MLD38_016891 [Melastoma candidum]|uniref:Uncharacterized protein n=1 Tax=Melastoma candidum TaxID=119954 RepID=A0ACB9QQ18_9MYRT|nr:hypothetical protein MLD38_016891 [Melastoma candidum]
MSKDEFLKIQTCVLKVNIHCDGCKKKVKKILQKIDGVFNVKIDSESGKVTVSGNADPNLLIKKLNKAGKHTELWGSQKSGNNNNQNNLTLPNQFKNLHLDGGKGAGGGGGGGGGGGNNKGQKGGGGGGGGHNQMQQLNLPKGGPQVLTPQQQQLLQQMKGFSDPKLPQFNNLKMPSKEPGPMNFQNDNDWDDDDEYDDEYDDDEFDNDYGDFDDELDVPHMVNKMKPGMGSGPGPNVTMPGMMKMGNGSGGGGNAGKKGGGNGGGAIPVQIASGNNGNGKKGGGGGGNPQNQGGSGGKNGGGKNGGMPDKNGHHGGGGGGPMANGNAGGGKKGGKGGSPFMENVFPQMGGNMKMPAGGQMVNMPMSQMGQMQAVSGLPTTSMGGGGVGVSEAYYRGSDTMQGNPYQQQQQLQQQQQQQQLQQQQQQQYLAAVMNQQRAMGNERFQPMMYARPPPAVNYMPAPGPGPAAYPGAYNPYQQYPYPPYAHPAGGDPYSYYFSEENPSSCNVM